MPEIPFTTRDYVNQLVAGDQVVVTHQVKVGRQEWTTETQGEVLRIERRRHGLHFRRNPDDKVYSDLIVLIQADGSLTTVTVDEFTELRKL